MAKLVSWSYMSLICSKLMTSNSSCVTSMQMRERASATTFDILDDIRKRLNEFTPLSMTLVQLSLTLKIFKCFMIRVKDELMRAEIMLPKMQDSH